MFSRLRKTPSFASTAQDSSITSSKGPPSVISSSARGSSKAPSVISSSSRRSSSTLREPSIDNQSSHLYHRPETPPEDYGEENSDAGSHNIRFPSLAPSEFSVDAVYKKRMAPRTPDSMSTVTEEGERESSPSRDSGYSDSNVPLLERKELGTQSAELCRELKTVTELSLDFLSDTQTQRETSRDLLAELNTKIRPFLITLDEEMSVQEEHLRVNLDRSRIADPRVTWLLIYNRFHLQFRKSLMEISTIYDDLENFLRLRDRGLEGVGVQEEIEKKLQANLHIMVEVEKGISEERARADSHYLVQ